MRAARKLAGTAQRQLADRAPVSVSLVELVEQVEHHREHSTIPALRREVASYLLPTSPGLGSRNLPELSADVARTSRLRRSAALDTLGVGLPGLLHELRRATHTFSARPDDPWLLGAVDRVLDESTASDTTASVLQVMQVMR